jgi:uncharacterized delta-60 repeat protein
MSVVARGIVVLGAVGGLGVGLVAGCGSSTSQVGTDGGGGSSTASSSKTTKTSTSKGASSTKGGHDAGTDATNHSDAKADAAPPHDGTTTDAKDGTAALDSGHDAKEDTGHDSGHDAGMDSTCAIAVSDKDAAAGSFDPTFNSVAEPASLGGAARLLQDSQGRIYLLGGKTNCVSATSNGDFAVTRLLPNGNVDTTYGAKGDTDAGFAASGGTVCIDFVGGEDLLGGGAFDPSGNIVIGGLSTLKAPSGAAPGRYYYTARAAFARLTPEGVLDPTFNGTGTNRVQAGPAEAQWVLAVATDSEGNVFGVGTTQAYPVPSSDDAATATYIQHAGFVMKLDSNGSVSNLWGTNGFVVDDNLTDLWGVTVSGSSLFVVGADLGEPVDGGIAGGLYHRRFVTRKYTTTDPGAADTTFNGGDAGKPGEAITAPGQNDYAQSVVVDPQGRVVVAGIASVGQPVLGGGGFNAGIYGPGYAAAVRYLPSGALDTTFGTGGIYVSPNLKGFPADELGMVGLQCDGKVIVGGITCPTANVATGKQQIGVLRLTAAGAPDPAYGAGGDAGTGITQIVLPYNAVVSTLLVDPEQRALVLSGVGGSGAMGPVLTRFLP